jgi:class 3 adenylate cyclase
LRRPGHLLGSHSGDDPVATQIPGARCVHIGSADFHWLGEDIDSILHEVSRFVTGHSRLPSPERVLCAVLFTDLVGSTERAHQLGDARWKSLLERHDRLITDEVERRGGRIVKTTGDGVLATLQSADRALQAADAIRDGLSAQGLSVRIGVHVGDVERRANDVAGMGVHLAARVMALAGPGEVFVTASVPMAVAGSHHRFELVGNRTLKGVPEEAAVFREIRPDS